MRQISPLGIAGGQLLRTRDGCHLVHRVRVDGCGVARDNGRCPQCRVHDRRVTHWQHGPDCDQPTRLELELVRLACAQDGSRRAELPAGLVPTWRMTRRGFAALARASLTDSQSEAARRFAVPRRKIADLTNALRTELPLSGPLPAAIGVDGVEIVGIGVCMVVVGLRPRRFIALVPGRPHKVFADWLAGRDRADLLAISTDADKDLRRVTNATQLFHVLDPFHVIKELNGCVQAVRQEHAVAIPLRWADERKDGLNRRLRQRWHRLEDGDRRQLEAVFAACPALGQAYALRESFISIYSIQGSERAEQAVTGWVEAIPLRLVRYFSTFLQTYTERWRQEMINFFTLRLTQGYTESINRRLKQRQLSLGHAATAADLDLWARHRYGGLAPEQVAAAIERIAARPRPPRRKEDSA